MTGRRLAILAARVAFTLFFLVTSFYCLLACVPFAYVEIIEARLIAWLTLFVRFHPWFYWAALLAVAPSLRDDLRRRRTKSLTRAFFAVMGGFGLFLMVRPVLPTLKNDLASFAWCQAALLPLLWVAAIDLAGRWRDVAWAEPVPGQERALFAAALKSGFAAWLIGTAIVYVRFIHTGALALSGRERVVAAAWSLMAQLLLFMALFVVLMLLRGLAAFFGNPAKAEFVLFILLGAGLTTLAFRRFVLSAVTFIGPPGFVPALALGFCLAAVVAGLAVRLRRPGDDPVTSGLALALSPLTAGRAVPAVLRPLTVLLIAGLAYELAVRTAVTDWNFMLQQLAIVGVWALLFGTLYVTTARPRPRRDLTVALLLVALATLGAYRSLESSGRRAGALLGDVRLDVAATLDRYAGYDVSYKILHDVMSRPREVEPAGDFYELLQRNTNISRDTPIAPVEVDFVPALAPDAPGRVPKEARPHIFIFVIDSLRKDYLSPYNPAVEFTPSIGRFAGESIVFRNAFTRYGATGLAEPSIWVGGMMPHKQYITPFYPMNALQKLIEAARYRSYITLDVILRVVVKPSPSIVPLDDGAKNRDADFCRSLTDLQEKLAARLPGDPPIFAYTQPQNLHVATINRQSSSVPPGESYPGFNAPYASRLKRLDACFGAFLGYLKDHGLEKDSIIILTSDHGDSLGEEGRWGHAYTVYPEVLKIPLIVRIPAALRARFTADPDALAFSTDITPTLYYLLGHPPTLKGVLFGRPLVTATARERARDPEESYMVASSYGPVYGVLGEEGRRLYVVDGVNYKDYFYDLETEFAGTRLTVTPEIRAENRERIREQIEELDRFYKVNLDTPVARH